jgi:hypothetical protein
VSGRKRSKRPQRCCRASDGRSLLSTGDRLLSQVVNLMISTPPVWEVMKYFAKSAMKNTATKKGVNWDAYKDSILNNPEVRA